MKRETIKPTQNHRDKQEVSRSVTFKGQLSALLRHADHLLQLALRQPHTPLVEGGAQLGGGHAAAAVRVDGLEDAGPRHGRRHLALRDEARELLEVDVPVTCGSQVKPVNTQHDA